MIYNSKKLYTLLENITIDYNIYNLQQNNELTLKVIEQKSSYYLHSKYNPSKQGLEFAKGNYEAHKNIILYGLGLGYHVIPIIEEVIAKGETLHIFELNLSILKIAFEKTNILEYLNNDNIILYATANTIEAGELLSQVLTKEDSHIILYEPSVRTIPVEMKAIKNLLDSYNIHNKSYEEQKDNIKENYDYNIKQNYPNASKLFRNSFENIPCIIVSAGHSLVENISLLKYAHNKAIIIAAGRTSDALKKENITPDFYIEGSNKDFTLEHFKNADTNVPLLMLSSANKNLKDYKGYKFLLYNNQIEYGGSVATLATSFAGLVGCNPIIYVGQDLCYSSEYTHNNEDCKVIETRGGLYVDGIDNNSYFTSKQFYLFKIWIENYIKAHPHIKFINCTAKGAIIEGAEHKDLKECLIDMPEFKNNEYHNIIKKYIN